jgi:geranylgeranyl diphosphate synthase type I
MMLASVEKLLVSSAEQLRGPTPTNIYDMVVHHMGWEPDRTGSGKRIRPLLLLLCYRGFHKDWEKALPAACAVEWLHNFSLIHDDIQDQSLLRRGRETVWKRWGIPQAINTGDALYALAHITYEQIQDSGIETRAVLAASKILNQACLRLTQGQHRDLVFVSEDNVTHAQYIEMITLKTSSLLSAAAAIGASLAGADQEQISSCRSFGHHLGLAFQILDDLLGVWGAPDKTGKITGDDLMAKKKTLPVIFGLEHSQSFTEWWASSTVSESEIQLQAEALEKLGARKFTKELAADHTQKALAALANAQLEQPARGELEGLTVSLLRRQG